MNSKIEFPHFINIKPSCEDQFEGKSHNRIAEVISKQLQKKDNTLRIIGIEGKWGSGKSTVISILKKKLNDKHKVALFDLWGHQEDAFKRTFIEEITDVLTKFEEFNDNDYFEKEKEKILA